MNSMHVQTVCFMNLTLDALLCVSMFHTANICLLCYDEAVAGYHSVSFAVKVKLDTFSYYKFQCFQVGGCLSLTIRR